jgi:hypothetical protein
MNKVYIPFLFCLLFCCNLISQNDGWGPPSFPQLKGKVSKTDANIRYTVDSTMSIDQRNDVIKKTEEAISRNLALINEADLDEPIHVVLFRELNYFGDKIWGAFMMKGNGIQENMIGSIYGPQRNSLNHELMQLITTIKWGVQKDNRLKWLFEGLAIYTNKDAFDYDGHTLEERYVYFMQNNKLFTTDTLLSFSIKEEMPHNKIAYNQIAYVVEYLISHYGIEKIKVLWQGGMDNFEMIYGLTFKDLMVNINDVLSRKYPNSIDFNWAAFNSDCFANQYDEWLPLNPLLYPGFEGMVSKVDGNIRYTVNFTRDIVYRNYIIEKIKRDITDNIKLINESRFDDFLHIILVDNSDEIKKYTGIKAGGQAILKDKMIAEHFNVHTIFCVFGEKYSPIKHELMHIIIQTKWGQAFNNSEWLTEGIASIADPETNDCDGHTYEQRYAYFLQNNKLLDKDKLKAFPFEWPQIKIAYNQSAFIVEYLFKKYGIEKFKQLWTTGVNNFKKIYGLSFEEILLNINTELNEKYPEPINLDWETFNRECIE